MDPQTLIQGAVTVGVGAIAGGLTNAVAIWMLFHPYEPRGPGRLKIQGAIPKNKARLAKSIGRTVGERLLTREDLAQRLGTPAVRRAFDKAMDGILDAILDRERGPLRDQLHPELATAVDDAVTSLAPRVADRVAAYARTAEFEALVAEWVARVQDELVTNTSLAASPAGTFGNGPQGPARDGFTQAVGRVRDAVERRIWREVIGAVPPERVARLASEVLSDGRGRRWVEESVSEIADRLLARPVGRPAEWFGPETTAALRTGISDATWAWMQSQIPQVVEHIHVPEMVEQRVLGFSTQRMEELVRGVTQRELNLIVRLGYVLGGLVGTIAFLVNVMIAS